MTEISFPEFPPDVWSHNPNAISCWVPNSSMKLYVTYEGNFNLQLMHLGLPSLHALQGVEHPTVDFGHPSQSTPVYPRAQRT